MPRGPRPIVLMGGIKDGLLRLQPVQRAQLARALRSWPNIPVVLELKPWKETRRNRANNFLWGVVYKLIAEETGHCDEDLHEYFKKRHNGKTIDITDPLTGVVHEERIGQSTAKLLIKPFSDYIEHVMSDGADLGIVFPEPRAHEEYRDGKTPKRKHAA
jgi:hypothetical protein